MAKQFRIAVDFDGTIVEHKFPDIGRPVYGAFDWLREWKEHGACLILWTMRSDGQRNGPVLTQAVDFCRTNGIEFDGINEGPHDRSWTESPKAYAHVYVDDAGFGCPLIYPRNGNRPYADWNMIGPVVLQQIVEYNNTHAPATAM